MVHKFNYNEEPEAALYQVSIVTKEAPSTRPPQLPKSFSCVDYRQDHSLVVLVGDSSLSSSSNGSSGTFPVICSLLLHPSLDICFALL
jgi:hypothetical protein